MHHQAPTLTMTDVALLAGVARPVVSMWRKRVQVRGETIPFPAPKLTVGRTEHFDRGEVVEYLRRTGRGNNTEADLDAPTLAVPAGADFEEVLSLLCLRALGGEDLTDMDSASLADLAADLDPEDKYVASEIAQLSSEGAASRAFVDELFEASYGASDALARILGGRMGREAGARGLNEQGQRLLAEVVSALADILGPDGVRIADGSDGRSDLVVRIADAAAVEARRAVEIPATSRAARRLRRLCALTGLSTADPDGTAAIVLVDVLGLRAVEALKAINEVQLDLPERSLAVAIGSAEALCDGVRDRRATQIRDDILRTGRLRMAVRLPRGLWAEAHRQALGLWVIGGYSSRPIAERRLALADLCDHEITALDLGDLATDAVASLTEEDRHSFRYARRLDTARVLIARTLVPPGMRAVARLRADASKTAVTIDQLAASLSEPMAPYRPLVSATGRSAEPRFVTLGDLKDRGHVILRRGSRLDASLAAPEGTITTLAPGTGPALAFDPLDLEGRFPNATRTKPGDVVFTDKPPAAVLDEAGGHLVAYPARILRLAPGAPLGPHALVALINNQAATAREWTAWRVPTFTADQRDQVEAELAGLAVTMSSLRERLAVADQLTHALIDGIAAAAITVPERHETYEKGA